MAQLISWPNIDVAKRRLSHRLKAAKDERKRVAEMQWRKNEKYVYKNDPAIAQTLNPLGNAGAGLDTEEFDDPEFVEIAYVFKDLRFLHAELSSNPPSVQATPLSSDLDARSAARAADQTAHWMLRRYQLQEIYDLSALDCLVYGTAITETVFDHELGEVSEFNKGTGEITMTGDISVSRVSPWDFYPAPRTTSRLALPWAFKRFRISVDAFLSRWPHLRDLLSSRLRGGDQVAPVLSSADGAGAGRSALDTIYLREDQPEEVELFEYWENALPENGQLGRYAVCFEDGTIVVEPRPSPLALPNPLTLDQRKKFKESRRKPRRRPARAIMPFHIWTDIDVPGRLWGKSFLEYAGPNQELMNNLDSALLELVKVHGLFRMILPAGAELEEGQFENDPARIIKLKSNPGDGTKIEMIPPAGVPGSMAELRSLVKTGVDDLAGVNESMFGTQTREQSGFSMQYAVNQGRMIRRRLFNKSVLFVESMYDVLLRLACFFWDDPQMVEVLGTEHAYDSVSLRGVDFDGGYKLEVEYGTSLPLDPDLRRDTILKYMPILEKAQIEPRLIAKALQLGDFHRLRDAVDLAEDRMTEIIDEIIATRLQVPPRKHQDHVGMIAWLKYYVMTADYRDLPENIKEIISEQIDLRVAAGAAEAPPAPGAAPMGPPGAVPLGIPGAPGPAGMPAPPPAMPPGPGLASTAAPSAT